MSPRRPEPHGRRWLSLSPGCDLCRGCGAAAPSPRAAAAPPHPPPPCPHRAVPWRGGRCRIRSASSGAPSGCREGRGHRRGGGARRDAGSPGPQTRRLGGQPAVIPSSSAGAPLTGERGWGRWPLRPQPVPVLGRAAKAGERGSPQGSPQGSCPRPGQVGAQREYLTRGLDHMTRGRRTRTFPGQRGTFCARDGSGFCLRKEPCPARAPPKGGSGVHPSVLRLPREGGPDEEGSCARSQAVANPMAPESGGSPQPGPARASRQQENSGQSTPG